MANTITNLTTSNTFLHWLTATQSAISILNKLTEGGVDDVFVANTNIEISNNVTITGNLTVGGNITLDAVGFDDLIVSGSAAIGTTLNVTGNTTLGTAIINSTNQETANITLMVGSTGNFINTSYNHANSGFVHSNSSFIHANASFVKANTAAADALAFAIALG